MPFGSRLALSSRISASSTGDLRRASSARLSAADAVLGADAAAERLDHVEHDALDLVAPGVEVIAGHARGCSRL